MLSLLSKIYFWDRIWTVTAERLENKGFQLVEFVDEPDLGTI
jgi:hypothetical protein